MSRLERIRWRWRSAIRPLAVGPNEQFMKWQLPPTGDIWCRTTFPSLPSPPSHRQPERAGFRPSWRIFPSCRT